MRRAVALLCTIPVLAVASCGEVPDTPDRVGDDFLRALRNEKWQNACDLVEGAKPTCATDFERDYGGRELEPLARGDYNEGGRKNDNESRFAFTTRGRAPSSTAYFEVGDAKAARPITFFRSTVD